ncbi:ATP-binding protein [Aquidulcibacter sp.]|uniref:ATP-binding protein n=1 Tax=Aquidulcibacter sp. TaxID=2052990 RepID=UPI0025C3194A|nr:ATP-binding protein [Aquidulcibacter sp.]MCA3697938.1 response regulator [Aquidulcibacter sp.]
MHQSYLELIKRLRDDLPSRTLAAIGFTGLLLWGIDGLAAILWFAAFALNEGLELLIGLKSNKDPVKGALNRRLFCANMVFGSSVWVAGALALVKTGEIGPLIIALAILVGALTHVISTSLTYVSAFLAAALPLVMGIIAVPAVMIVSHAYPDAAVFQASIAMVFLLTYNLSAALQSWQRETKLAKTLAQVSLASDAKSQFLATMSHEIRTPLNGIVGLAEVLNNTKMTASQHEMVNLVRTSGETLERLVSDVLDSAKIEADKLELSIAPFDLRETIETAAHTFRTRAEEKGVVFSLIIPPEAEGRYLGDAVRIRQIISNLTSNAIKFTDKGRVDVKVDALEIDGDSVELRIQVSDTGIGFDPKASQHLFSRFEQADNSISRRFGGTGLGLSICKSLCELMDGSISATSQLGAGSRFEVRIQVKNAEALKANPRLPAHVTLDDALSLNDSSVGPTGLRVLVAEDNPINQKVITFMLEPMGMTPVMAANGREALAFYKIDSFDLILMDMMMPEMDGLAATQAIRAWEKQNNLPRTPIAMLSANAMSEHVTAALAAGCDVHIAKPVTPATLVTGMTEALFMEHDENGEPDADLQSRLIG